MLSGLGELLTKKKVEQLVSIDIGTSAIKVMELDVSGKRPKLIAVGIGATPAGAINNNVVTKSDQVASVIRSVIEANDIKATKAVVALPGPCAFIKKISVAAHTMKDLEANIAFEAGNYIPHRIENVFLDYQVLRNSGNGSMEVLLVAVKNEIVSALIDTVSKAGLEPVIADVDYFALENMFELNYPEEKKHTVALINVGARFSSINIMQDGESLFAGDVSVGSRLYTDALCETLNMQPIEAEQAKSGKIPANFDANLVHETIERTTEHVVSELHRQLGFYWNAAATDRAIEAIFVCGGGAQVQGLIEELHVRTGSNCKLIESFRQIDWSSNFDKDFIHEIEPAMSVSVGLAIRRLGDKKHSAVKERSA